MVGATGSARGGERWVGRSSPPLTHSKGNDKEFSDSPAEGFMALRSLSIGADRPLHGPSK